MRISCLPYRAKFSRHIIFTIWSYRTFSRNKEASYTLVYNKISYELNLRGLKPIRENRKNYAPRREGRDRGEGRGKRNEVHVGVMVRERGRDNGGMGRDRRGRG